MNVDPVPGLLHTRMVPSGFRRLCSARLSEAFSNQNVAVTASVPECKPKSRHMTPTVDEAGSAAQPTNKAESFSSTPRA
ncbi:Uncharacterised protein [Mycobacterium tuberculosis]|nr:Uncharacterised protein [Mycobacterium tuberculosis]